MGRLKNGNNLRPKEIRVNENKGAHGCSNDELKPLKE